MTKLDVHGGEVDDKAQSAPCGGKVVVRRRRGGKDASLA